MAFEVHGKVWRWESDTAGAGWFFLTVEGQVAAEIRFAALGCTSRFGSIRVTATICETSWEILIFPDPGSGSFLLPLKAEVRRRGKIEEGSEVTILLTV